MSGPPQAQLANPAERADDPMPEQVAANRRRAALVVAGVPALALAGASLLVILLGLGLLALLVAAVIVVGAAVAAYRTADAVVLAVSHARRVGYEEQPRLHNLVEGLCIAAGLPKPAIHVVDDPAPNAFATGRGPRHAAVAVTTGMVEKMSRIELEGVLAHELSHVKSRDVLLSTLAATFVAGTALLADVGLRYRRWGGPRHADDQRPRPGGAAGAVLGGLGSVLLLGSPLVARALRVVVGRRRESLADASAATLTRYPPGLVAALEKLKDGPTAVHSASRATAHLWLAPPLARTPASGRVAWADGLFDTQPSLEERIQALKEL